MEKLKLVAKIGQKLDPVSELVPMRERFGMTKLAVTLQCALYMCTVGFLIILDITIVLVFRRAF